MQKIESTKCTENSEWIAVHGLIHIHLVENTQQKPCRRYETFDQIMYSVLMSARKKLLEQDEKQIKNKLHP